MSRPLPEGSWDCHAHVFDDRVRYPLAPGREYEPPLAPLESYLDMLDTHGIARGVLVQPSIYGFDNRCLLDALERAEGRLLGVVVPAPDSGAEELEALHRRGVRGVRCNLLNANGLPPQAVLAWQPVMADLGWHVAFHIDVEAVPDLRAWLDPFTVPVVIDHMGRPHEGSTRPPDPATTRETCPGFHQLVNLVAEGRCLVKLSAPYRLSKAPPPWTDVTPMARALLAANPLACLWATDWPHVHTATSVRVADTLVALEDWCSSDASREQLLTQAPRMLLGTDYR